MKHFIYLLCALSVVGCKHEVRHASQQVVKNYAHNAGSFRMTLTDSGAYLTDSVPADGMGVAQMMTPFRITCARYQIIVLPLPEKEWEGGAITMGGPFKGLTIINGDTLRFHTQPHVTLFGYDAYKRDSIAALNPANVPAGYTSVTGSRATALGPARGSLPASFYGSPIFPDMTAPTKGTTGRRGKGRKKASITSWDVTDWRMTDTGALNSPLGWDIKTTHLVDPHDTVVIEGDVHFLRIGCCTYRIIRPEAYIEEMGANPWTGFGIDEGPAGWGAMDTAKIAAYFDSVKLPWSVEPLPPSPYTGTRDSSGMWIWGRNRGTIAGQPEILWYPATSALLRKVSDSFVLSTDQSDTNRVYAGPKKKKLRSHE